VLLLQQRFQLFHAEPVEIGKLNARRIHIIMVRMSRVLSSKYFAQA
jgi:hypothetical protein